MLPQTLLVEIIEVLQKNSKWNLRPVHLMYAVLRYVRLLFSSSSIADIPGLNFKYKVVVLQSNWNEKFL